ncbi:MAG TPA: HIRAN domain-containing protein [Sphingomonas sp.]|jgi:hypothetical protein
MTGYRVRLAATDENQEAVRSCEVGQALSVYSDPDDPRYWLAVTADGRELGTLPRRGKLIDAVLAGGEMVGAAVQSVSAPTEAKPGYGLTVNVEVSEGAAATAYQAGLAALRANAAPPPAPRTYKVGIVGENNYQPAIRGCTVGQRVRVLHETGNPHDDLALVVVATGGKTIGYIPRDHWLRRAIHEEGQGCAATIAAIERAGGGSLGVVIDVAMNGRAIEERGYRQSGAAREPSRDVWVEGGISPRMIGVGLLILLIAVAASRLA